MPSTATVLDKWTRNMTAAVPTIKAGILAVSESPMEKAANAADRYVEGVRRAKESGKFQAGLRSVTLEQWKQLAGEKGTARIAQGVTAAKDKMRQFLDKLLPYTEQASREIQAMPKGTPEASMARMMRNFEIMSRFKGKG